MTSSARGTLRDNTGTSLGGLTIVVRDVWAPIPRDIASAQSGAGGEFLLVYPPGDMAVNGPRMLQFRVLDQVHRILALVEQPDNDLAVLELGTVEIHQNVATGWLVTLGTDKPKPEVRPKNAVGVLIDNVTAWQRVAKVIKESTSSIELMQLEFDVPEEFNAAPASEVPNMVLQFGSPLVTPAGVTRPVGPGDDRPERLLLDAVARNPAVNVKILISQPVIDSHLVATGAVLVPVVGAVLVLLVGGFLEMLGVGTTLDEVERYFEHSAQPLRNIKGATSSVFGPTHAKLAIVDGKTAVSIASPLIQGYYGDAAHAIDDPRRGNYRGIPVHDVSFAVTGPVVYDLHETYRLHWNVVASTDNQITPLPQPPPSPTDLGGLDAFASLQVVRTLAGGRFDDPKDGEKGVLEAYLRAIANAESFIYMENQYLTNDTIGTALLQALTDPKRPNLNVIVLVNIHPDVPGYSGWQRNLIDRIRQGMVKAGLSQESRKRFGVFTRWTHEAAKPPGQPRARIAPNYIHAKVAIVDNSIATLGSANLDGASLDYFQVLHALHFGDVRNSEVNFLVLNNIENQPETPVVDNLRRSLWAEHLGIEDAGGNPDPGNQMLALQNQPAGGWVELWRNVAAEKLEALKAHPENPVRVRVLPWPDAGKTLSEPREHLAALLGKPENALGLDTVAGTRRFSFKEGRYQDKTPDLG